MFGCCERAMAVKYADKDGIVDQSYVDENYPAGSKVVDTVDADSPWSEYLFKTTGKYPMVSTILDLQGHNHEYCKCPCHWRGGPTVMC